MTQIIGVIALDPFAGKAYASQVCQVFGSTALVRNYSIMDGSVGQMDRCDLYMISTDALDAMKKQGHYLPDGAQAMEIQVTYRKEAIIRLREIPKGTTVLFVNLTETMAREAVTQLEQLGVTHLKFILYAPGCPLGEIPRIAVTPDEERYVPEGVKQIINLGQRTCSADTMIEAAMRLGLSELLEEEGFRNYQESVCANTYYFDQMFSRSRRLESQFDMLMDVLDQGVVAVDEKGDIYAINPMARDITHVLGDAALNQQGGRVFPYIPFDQCLRDKKETEPKVVRVAGSLVSVYVRLVLRREQCVGAFAILQKFNEMERRQNELRGQLMKKGQGHRAKYCFDDVIGQSEAIRYTKEILRKMARTESPVLLIGETGTGKELFAHSVHNASRRSSQPFVAVNCGAMPENLLESELFGYEEGAFTGAKKGGRPGLFEFAHQGTLFLDEVEGMSPALQVKLLRVLQEREIMRGEDIFLILEHFRQEMGGKFALSQEIRQLFREYPWYGNVRELHNVAEYLNFTGRDVITERELPPTFQGWKSRGKDLSPGVIRRLSPHPVSGKENRTGARQVVLELLFEASRDGRPIGRDGILKESAERGLHLTQPQVRTILKSLEQEGCILIRRGRGGSVITEKGIQVLRERTEKTQEPEG